MRSGSLAAIDCRKSIVSASLETGAVYVTSVSGALPSAANAPVFARACSGCASAKRAVDEPARGVGLGSETLSVASPAVLMTFAVVLAV